MLQCVATPGTWDRPAGTTLYHDGAAGYPAGTTRTGKEPDQWNSAVYTTGWTPVSSAPAHASLVYDTFGDATTDVGFLSMDDRLNTTGADPKPVSFTVNFPMTLSAGTHLLDLRVASSGWTDLGVQSMVIEVEGADDTTGLSSGCYVGNPGNTSPGVDPSPYKNYTHLALGGTDQTLVAAVTVGSARTITIVYTFTLYYVTGGRYQNADIWVAAPKLASC